MSKNKRNRRLFSMKQELIHKSQEAILAAIQIYNSPLIKFKAELFIVTINIAWTYLLHAYFRDKKIDCRYYKAGPKRRKFDRTKHGAFKYWELERCLNDDDCPLDKNTNNNLRFLIQIRHEIEHQMTLKIDDFISAKFQACCLNYNHYITKLFGPENNMTKYLDLSIQFSQITPQQQEDSKEYDQKLPKNIAVAIRKFESNLSQEEFNSPNYAYRVYYIEKLVNHQNQADKVITFSRGDVSIDKAIQEKIVIKETEKKKYSPKQIVEQMRSDGYPKYKIHNHTDLWKSVDARNSSKSYGARVVKTWYWYDNWLNEVRKHCAESGNRYK